VDVVVGLSKVAAASRSPFSFCLVIYRLRCSRERQLECIKICVRCYGHDFDVEDMGLLLMFEAEIVFPNHRYVSAERRQDQPAALSSAPTCGALALVRPTKS
jgi:hypothetical protein